MNLNATLLENNPNKWISAYTVHMIVTVHVSVLDIIHKNDSAAVQG